MYSTFIDNSAIRPTISSIPALQPSMKFKIGLENVMVQASDVTGNVAKCSFSITVKGDLTQFYDSLDSLTKLPAEVVVFYKILNPSIIKRITI